MPLTNKNINQCLGVVLCHSILPILSYPKKSPQCVRSLSFLLTTGGFPRYPSTFFLIISSSSFFNTRFAFLKSASLYSLQNALINSSLFENERSFSKKTFIELISIFFLIMHDKMEIQNAYITFTTNCKINISIVERI